MTSDEFHARYRLHERVAAGDGIHTHRAEEIGTGRAVMVHRRDGASADVVDRVQRLLALLPTADRGRVLDSAFAADGFVVVTEPIAGLTSFAAWLADRTAGTGGPQVGRPPVPGMASGPVPVAVRPSAAPAPERDPPLPPTGEEPVAFSFSVGGPPAGSAAADAPGGGTAASDGTPTTGEYTRVYVFGGQAHMETQATPPDAAALEEFAAREAVVTAPGEGAAPAGRTTPVASRAVGRGPTPPRPRVALAPERRLRPLLVVAAVVAALALALVFLLRGRGSAPSSGAPGGAAAGGPGQPSGAAAPASTTP